MRPPSGIPVPGVFCPRTRRWLSPSCLCGSRACGSDRWAVSAVRDRGLGLDSVPEQDWEEWGLWGRGIPVSARAGAETVWVRVVAVWSWGAPWIGPDYGPSGWQICGRRQGNGVRMKPDAWFRRNDRCRSGPAFQGRVERPLGRGVEAVHVHVRDLRHVPHECRFRHPAPQAGCKVPL